jgi:plastocyanin
VYQWWVLIHLVGVFTFLASHGVSMIITFRLQRERDPRHVASLLQLSSSTISVFYVSLGVLLAGGIVAASLGNLWGYGWIWAALIMLVLVSLAMYGMARPYYRRVRFVTNAIVEGSQAVSAEQYDSILGSGRPMTIAGIGLVGLLVILYLMLFKPTLGLAPTQAVAQARGTTSSSTSGGSGVMVSLAAAELSFSTEHLSAPADKKFILTFDNRAAGVTHNVEILTSGGQVVFNGSLVSGPHRVAYHVPPLNPGTYRFICTVHPQQMTGTLVAR